MRVAILDMYKGKPGQHGMRCLRDILNNTVPDADVQAFDVRVATQIPDLSFDLYISSGGPGNPLDIEPEWSDRYFSLVDDIFEWNNNNADRPKYFFAICHSFQLLCAHTGIGRITERKKFSFGVTGIRKTEEGKESDFLSKFPEVFYAADHRYFQVVDPDVARLNAIGAQILGVEELSDTASEDSLMVVSFSPYIIGTQFHPEVDVYGMEETIGKQSIRIEVEKVFGKGRIERIQDDVGNPDKIEKMYRTMLPDFIRNCSNKYAAVYDHEPIN